MLFVFSWWCISNCPPVQVLFQRFTRAKRCRTSPVRHSTHTKRCHIPPVRHVISFQLTVYTLALHWSAPQDPLAPSHSPCLQGSEDMQRSRSLVNPTDKVLSEHISSFDISQYRSICRICQSRISSSRIVCAGMYMLPSPVSTSRKCCYTSEHYTLPVCKYLTQIQH